MLALQPRSVGETIAGLVTRAERRGEQWGFAVETVLVAAVLIAAAALLTDGEPAHALVGVALGTVFLGLWAARLWHLVQGSACPRWFAYGSAGLQGLVVGWFVGQVTPDQPGIALIAFIVLVGLHSLRLQPSLTAAAGILYSVEIFLFGLLRMSRATQVGPIPPLPEFLRAGLLLMIVAFLWYVVRSARSLLEYQAEEAHRREQALTAIAQELEQRVSERTDRLQAAIAQQAALRERQRIAEDLHDGLAKSVAGFALQLQVLAGKWKRQPEVAADLKEISQTANELAMEARRALSEVRAGLGCGGLAEQLARLTYDFTARTGIPVDVDADASLPELSPEMWYDLRCIALEGLENVQRHSAATRARIRLAPTAGGFEMVLEDDGRGLDNGWSWHALRGERRYGLLGISERVERHGGRARFDRTGTLGGCRIEVQLPRAAGGA